MISLICFNSTSIWLFYKYLELQGISLVVSKNSWYSWDPKIETSSQHLGTTSYWISPSNNLVYVKRGLHVLEEIVRYPKSLWFLKCSKFSRNTFFLGPKWSWWLFCHPIHIHFNYSFCRFFLSHTGLVYITNNNRKIKYLLIGEVHKVSAELRSTCRGTQSKLIS